MRKDSGDRPATEILEIEITPEMIEAGVRAYEDTDGWYCTSPREVVCNVFMAMLEVSGSSNNLRRHLEEGTFEAHP